MRAAVLGSPISHSLSPLLHMTAYQRLGIAAQYSAIDLPLHDAPEFLRRAQSHNWRGFSLTMPLKEAIFGSDFNQGADLAFEVDPLAARLRSANTLVRRGDHFFATSTDTSAFTRLLADISKSRVAIIGGGGTARAALGALDQPGARIDFLLRSPKRSELLSSIALHSTLNFFDMNHSLSGYDVVISTLPAEAVTTVRHLLSGVTAGTLFDVLYHPYPTESLAYARSVGMKTLDGMDLLVEQALDQISLFGERPFDYDEMRECLLAVGRAELTR